MSVDPAGSSSQAPSAPTSYPDPIPGVIPFGTICTLAGASGVGKNAMISGWVDRWLTGRTICGHATHRPAAIGMLAGDRRWKSHRIWLDVAGVGEIPHYSLRDDPKFNWATLRRWESVPTAFNKALDALNLPPGGLLIADPLSLWIPGKLNDYKDVAIGLGTLGQLLAPRQLTCLGIFHQSKSKNDLKQAYTRPQDRILGSAAQLGFSDTAIYLLSPEDLDKDYYGLGWVPHNAPPETHFFQRESNGLFQIYHPPAEELADDAPEDRSPGGSNTRALSMCTLLPDVGGIERHVWAARTLEAGVVTSKATITRDIAWLIERGYVNRDAHGRYSRGAKTGT